MDPRGRRAEARLAERRSWEARAKRGDEKARTELEALDFGEAILRSRRRTAMVNAQIQACADALRGDREELASLRHVTWLPGNESALRSKFCGDETTYSKFKVPTDLEMLVAVRAFLKRVGALDEEKPRGRAVMEQKQRSLTDLAADFYAGRLKKQEPEATPRPAGVEDPGALYRERNARGRR